MTTRSLHLSYYTREQLERMSYRNYRNLVDSLVEHRMTKGSPESQDFVIIFEDPEAAKEPDGYETLYVTGGEH